MEKNEVSLKQVFKYILKVIKPYYFHLVLAIIIVSIDAFIVSYNPYILKIIIDKVANHNKEDIFSVLYYTFILFVFLKILGELIWRLYDYFLLIKMQPKLKQDIINYNTDKILSQTYDFFQNNYSGKISHYIVKLSQYIPDILDICLNKFLTQLVTFGISIYLLNRTSTKYALFLIVFVIIFFSIILLFNKYIVKKSKDLAENNSKISGKLVDILTNILVIKLFSNSKRELKETYEISNKSVTAEKKLHIIYQKCFISLGIAATIFELICIYFLIIDWQKSNISMGDFGFIIYLNNSIIMLMWLNIDRLASFTQIMGETQQALSYIYSPIKLVDKENAKSLNIKKGEIIFDNVTFKYENKAKYIFKNFSLKIHPKEKVGIVGHSGGGKSTFIKLLLRLFDLQKGKILIDNQDIANVTQDSLRNNIGVIPQDTSLFHKSLFENMRYGNQTASEHQVFEASKKAHAHNFILKTSDKYDTLVGERGVKISGGQRQRIAIARTILKNALILILDEATSQLDSITEKSIQNSVGFLMKDKTTIVIAHRLSTLMKMDRILVFENGKIVEEGSHEDLIAQKGAYYKLWKTQVNGFIPDEAE